MQLEISALSPQNSKVSRELRTSGISTASSSEMDEPEDEEE